MNRKTNQVIRRAALRRKQDRYRMLFRFTAALLVVMTVTTLTVSIRSFALSRDDALPSYKYYTTYTVRTGDSLDHIAREHMGREYSSEDKYIAEVMSINHLSSASMLMAGQELVIPYYSVEKL